MQKSLIGKIDNPTEGTMFLDQLFDGCFQDINDQKFIKSFKQTQIFTSFKEQLCLEKTKIAQKNISQDFLITRTGWDRDMVRKASQFQFK